MQSVNTAGTNFKEGRINSMRKRMANALLRTKAALMNPSGDQMTGWLIVVLIVVVVGAVFMTLYQGSITQIWNSIVAKITNLLN